MKALKFILPYRLWILLWLTFVCLRQEFALGEIDVKLPTLDWKEVEQAYEEGGKNYAIKLYQKQDGSAEDDKRAQKSDLLSYKIREKAIRKIMVSLAKEPKDELKREMMHRLGTLQEEQAETISHQNGNRREEKMNEHLLAAISWYTRAHKQFPTWNADYLLFSIAEDYAKLKNFAAAERGYKELIQSEKNSPLLSDALLALGNLYFDKQAFSLARSNFQKILSTKEEKLHPYAYYKMAWCFFNEAEHEQAMNSLENAIKQSRLLQEKQGDKKLGVEEEALSDLVLFYAEYANPNEAKSYFEKIAPAEKARDLRFSLVKRYYDHGQHSKTKIIASSLLAENSKPEQKSKLYLILISVAEKLKDRNLSLETAEKYSAWIKDQPAGKKEDRAEGEEYMRHYAQRLHYEAETMKNKQVWAQARKSYEIYLSTYGTENDSAEARFRYGVLLMNQRDFLTAKEQMQILISQISAQHPRHNEAMKLQVQSIEMALAKNKNSIAPKEQLLAYDAFIKAYPKDALHMEASYKAAQVAKILESPEQVAERLRMIAEMYPEQKLARSALAESLSVLVQAEKWEALRNASNAAEKLSLKEDGEKNELRTKILEAKELAMLKIAESLENMGKNSEAMAQYESFLKDSTSENFQRYSLGKLATLAEIKLHNNEKAIDYWNAMKERFADSKEGKQAYLELARLHEKSFAPFEAIDNFIAYSEKTGGHMPSLTNAAILLESLGENERASKIFLLVYEKWGQEKKDAKLALESGCNNLLAGSQNKSSQEMYRNLASCSKKIARGENNSLLWQAREAWALEKAGDGSNADKIWTQIGAIKPKSLNSELDKNLYAVAKIKNLEVEFSSFQKIRFSKTNEKPEANILKKSKAMDALEARVAQLAKYVSSKQALQVQNILQKSYLDFAETMENAAVPSKLSEEEKRSLKENFQNFAQEMKKKALALEERQKSQLLASAIDGNRKPASTATEAKISVSKIEYEKAKKELQLENTNIHALAQISFYLVQEGKFGEARYFSQFWKKLQDLKSNSVASDRITLETVAKVLEKRFPNEDPAVKELL